MDISSKRLATLLLTAGMLAGACSSTTSVAVDPAFDSAIAAAAATATATTADSTPAESTTADSTTSKPATAVEPAAAEPAAAATSTTEVDAALQTGIANIAEGYRRAANIWTGFVPNEHPVVLAIKDSSDKLTGALAINHPQADKLGEAIALDTANTPFTTLHLISNPTDAATLQGVATFEFNTEIGGINSFLMNAGGADDFFDITKKDYAATLLHEMFHRYQITAFAPDSVGQDVDGYPYTPQNLALAGLEERALIAAVDADSVTDRTTAARHFVAIRQARLAAEPRVALDSSQEVGEGTARYIEHLLGADDTGYGYHAGNFSGDLLVSLPASGVKENMGFGRWYASGAAILHLLDELGVENVASRVEAGEVPSQMLAQALNVDNATPAERDQMVNAARAAYDPSNELATQAAKAAEAVKSEPSFFGEESDDGEAGHEGHAHGADAGEADESESFEGGEEITDAQLECLAQQGVDLDDASVEISEDAWNACFEQS